jgi:methionine sulfoxide reductase catalytic subunit
MLFIFNNIHAIAFLITSFIDLLYYGERITREQRRSYQYTDGDEFYEVLDLEIVKHPQTILAYEMNGEPLDIGHGSPIRLRVESQLGYKMVKWLKSIEFVNDYKNIGMGQGGHREDHMYYSPRAGI